LLLGACFSEIKDSIFRFSSLNNREIYAITKVGVRYGIALMVIQTRVQTTTRMVFAIGMRMMIGTNTELCHCLKAFSK